MPEESLPKMGKGGMLVVRASLLKRGDRHAHSRTEGEENASGHANVTLSHGAFLWKREKNRKTGEEAPKWEFPRVCTVFWFGTDV